MVDLIAKKRDGAPHTEEELRWIAQGAADGSLPDYQLAAWLMAVYLRGMTEREAVQLTAQMAATGEQVDLSALPGVTVDKHSTGGVGDKTTLVVGPAAAACGVVVAKMSGRGLGFTGGTVDKLESIPGYRTALSREEFLAVVRQTGLSLIGQSEGLAPADKRLYALRDVTATVESLPLIAASIMSKKLAAGARCILLDVKYGSGAFMKTPGQAAELARVMCRIGAHNGRRTAALVTGMDIPLGYAVGNALEVREALEVLRGGGPGDLRQVCLELTARLLELAGLGALAACREKARWALDSGAAFEKLSQVVSAQGGDAAVLQAPARLPLSPCTAEYTAPRDGFIVRMDTAGIGRAAMVLGAGRARKEDAIDHGAGLVLCRKTGERVVAGEPIARLYAADSSRLRQAQALLSQSIVWGESAPVKPPLIEEYLTSEDEVGR